ncbi:hypothetical protein C8R44DRAFT_880102 [Mycena epipterygia]|nr:hypothetical protein C8R44DRAFT_880102 [Mycena epipterygia]
MILPMNCMAPRPFPGVEFRIVSEPVDAAYSPCLDFLSRSPSELALRQAHTTPRTIASLRHTDGERGRRPGIAVHRLRVVALQQRFRGGVPVARSDLGSRLCPLKFKHPPPALRFIARRWSISATRALACRPRAGCLLARADYPASVKTLSAPRVLRIPRAHRPILRNIFIIHATISTRVGGVCICAARLLFSHTYLHVRASPALRHRLSANRAALLYLQCKSRCTDRRPSSRPRTLRKRCVNSLPIRTADFRWVVNQLWEAHAPDQPYDKRHARLFFACTGFAHLAFQVSRVSCGDAKSLFAAFPEPPNWSQAPPAATRFFPLPVSSGEYAKTPARTQIEDD